MENTAANKLASRLIELTLYSRKATATNGAFGLKERLLFCLLNEPLPTAELMERLCMVKSNFALLANKCIAEKLITKQSKSGDRRALVYYLTNEGKQYVEELLTKIGHKFDTVLTGESQIAEAEAKMAELCEILSYLP